MFYESFYVFFLICSLIYFLLEYKKTTRSGFACIQGGKTSKFKSRKNRRKLTFIPIFFYRTYYFVKRHDMKQYTTFKIILGKTPAIWDTLMIIVLNNMIDDFYVTTNKKKGKK